MARSVFAYFLLSAATTFEIISAYSIFCVTQLDLCPKVLIINSGSSGPRGSVTQSKRKLPNHFRLVNKKKKKKGLHAPAISLHVCSSSKVNAEIRLPDSLQMSCRSARRTCRAAPRRALRPGSVIFFAAAIGLWDYPCQVNLEPEFHICSGSCCQDESEELLHSVRSVAVAVTSRSPFPFIRTWPGRSRCD